jgi:hypothetical protein
MSKSTSRRTSLQPVFEPFGLLESEAIGSAPSTNGYHLESLDEEMAPANGSHADHNQAHHNGSEINGAEIIGDLINGSVANGSGFTDESPAEGIPNAGPAIVVNGAVDHPANRIAEQFDADPDMADLAAATEAFSAALSNSISNQNDTSSHNGHSQRNGDSHRNGDSTLDGTEKLNGTAGLNGTAELNGTAIASPSGFAPAVVARDSHPPALPVDGVEPVESAAESSLELSSESSSPDASLPTAAGPLPHPASGSLFVPYLVTEIRELRDRRRRSWWRRIFG